MAQAEVFDNVDLLAIIATNLEHRDVIRMIASSKNNLTGSGRVWLEEKRGFFLSRVKYVTLLWRKLNNPPCLEFDMSCVMDEIHTIFSSNRHSSNDQRLLDVLDIMGRARQKANGQVCQVAVVARRADHPHPRRGKVPRQSAYRKRR